MNKILINFIVALTSLLSFAGVSAKESNPVESADTLTVGEAFVNLPLPVLDLLTRSNRMDMIDYLKVDSLWQAPNTMGGLSVIELSEPNHLKVKLTDVSSLDIALLPAKIKGTDRVVMTIYTVGTDSAAPDSEICFFMPDMTQLPTAKFFKSPQLKDFFSIPKGSLTKMKELEEMVPFPTYLFSLTGADSDPVVTGRLTVTDVMPEEDRHIVDLFRVAERQWRWNGKEFRLKE